jgi:hypothetical protein
MCNQLDEDGGHLFLKCKKMKQVWRKMLLEEVRLQLISAINPMAMFQMICKLPKEKRSLSLVLLWDWWNTRNKVNAGKKERSADEVCHMIEKHNLVFGSNGNSAMEVGSVWSEVCWVKPPQGQVKVNFDASFHEGDGTGAWGFVARTDASEFIVAATGRLKHLRDAL